MKLLIGGAHQGKLDCALRETGLSPERVLHGGSCPLDEWGHVELLAEFHLFVERLLRAGRDPWEAAEALLAGNPEIVIVCDEVGCGVVPVDPFAREWRETVGRLCCELARRASRVERVFCGIPQVIKASADETGGCG